MRNVLFDLDGTLTDPCEGITACFRYALGRLGRPCPPAEELARYIGPPIRPAFGEILQSADARLIEEAVAVYRERFAAVGLYENRVYDGVPEMLAGLRSAGFRLYVATSKPQPYAEEVLRHFALDPYFDDVQGNELGGRLDDKAELVRELLTRRGLRADSSLMVGDRRHDVRAARENGLRSIGVTYGYGSGSELKEAGADHVVGSPAAVEALIKTL
ncbi:MAG TPA: HAD hydrolase-like protein [Pyrinomonadaceae bacterium]|nr:HAD hydrolase-like protein [Pyrinomonadaceae bacterium]